MADKIKSAASLYKAITTKQHIVSVHGEQMALKAPSPADIDRVTEAQIAFGELNDGARDTKQAAELMLNLAAVSVKACTTGLTDAQARHFVTISGGVTSDLASTAMRLCGLDSVVIAMLASGDADPTI